jgi:hypothetical protein
MPRVQWPLRQGRPYVEVVLAQQPGGQSMTRILIADTGAGAQGSRFHLILDEVDCLHCGGTPNRPVKLGGAYVGSFPTYMIRVKIPSLGFDKNVRAVGVPSAPEGFDGIACFSFLNRFTYGNFGDQMQFGLEC